MPSSTIFIHIPASSPNILEKLNSTSFILNLGSMTTAIAKTRKHSFQYWSNFSFKGMVKSLTKGS
uniref:Zinc finger BED domain-containing protein RICESLEEPER 1-like n=1 Tax=Rhizophora mucronata TaxID=61149 RepID=A0A2P2KFH3_RHIMU